MSFQKYLLFTIAGCLVFAFRIGSVAQEALPERMPLTPVKSAETQSRSFEVKDALSENLDIDLPPLSAEESQGLFEPANELEGSRKIKTGVVRIINIPFPEAPQGGIGKLHTLPNGQILWTIRIRSEGAAGLRVQFADFSLPDGASVVVSDPRDVNEFYGPFAGTGPHADGAFTSPTIHHDEVVVEARLPSAENMGSFLISTVVHRAPDPVNEKVELTCHVDITCQEGFEYKSAIGRMEFIQEGAAFNCSGTLLVDSDPNSFVPYFLTANHCFTTQAEANTLEVYWLYETAVCDGAPPNLESLNRSIGATLLATGAASDYTFLRLDQQPPAGLFFLGWDASDSLAGSNVHCIHHPDGEFKRISFGNITQDFDFQGYDEDDYWIVQFSLGATEAGSSGCPLIIDGQVVGTLTGGTGNSCTQSTARDLFGRFSRTFFAIDEWIAVPVAPSTPTPTVTITETPTSTSPPTRTHTPTLSATASPSPTHTFNPTSTETPTITLTSTESPSATVTNTGEPTATETASETVTPTATDPGDLTATPTETLADEPTPTFTLDGPTPTETRVYTVDDADINDDGRVDDLDLLILLQFWKQTAAP